jgi:glyoxylase-like metal-dependent hydrolase (beta-lactamase superfamily II)
MIVASDGPLDVGVALDVLRPSPGSVLPARVLVRERLILAQNVLVMRSGAGWTIFETGAGPAESHTRAGHLATLASAGVDQRDVVDVVPSHAHPDHIGGIVNRQGQLNHPAATIHLAEAEVAYWLDDARLSDSGARSALVARRSLGPHRDRITDVRDGAEIVPGVHAVATPGHTTGHRSFLIAAGRQSLFVSGDLAHHESQVEQPGIGTSFDLDPALAAASRRRMLDFLSSTQTMALFYHFRWPGLGHVEKRGDGFRFVPLG